MSKREANAKLDREQERLDRLAANQKRRGAGREETKAFLHQNRKVNEAAKNASWWKR